MAKPIFIIKNPSYDPDSFDDINELVKEILDEYYVIIVRSYTGDFEFECFYEKDFTEVKFEELKKEIKNCLKNKI